MFGRERRRSVLPVDNRDGAHPAASCDLSLPTSAARTPLRADEAGYSERTVKEQGVRGRRVRNLQARSHAPTPRRHINEPSCAREKFRGDYALEASLFTKPPTPVKSVVISRSHSRSGQLRY